MAHDEALACRVRDLLAAIPDVDERAMFGGLAFLDRGHMCCGIVGAELMVRVGPDGAAEALRRPHARPMDFTGRPMTGMVYVAAPGLEGAALGEWIDRGLAFTRSLAAKPAKPVKPATPRKLRPAGVAR